MAQLVLTIAGGVAGNAIGGGLGQSLGALLGAVAGGFIDKELFGPQSERRKTETGKLSDIRVSGSAYGQTVPRVYGRVPANVIWARGIREEVAPRRSRLAEAAMEKAASVVEAARPSRRRATTTTPMSPLDSVNVRSPRSTASGSTGSRSTPSTSARSGSTTARRTRRRIRSSGPSRAWIA